MADTARESISGPSWTLWTRLAIGLGLLAATWGVCAAWKIDPTAITPESVRAFVLSFGVWAPLIYLLVIGQPFVPLPASIMLGAAGVAFGLVWGTAIAWSGLVIRACGQFGLARLCGRALIERLLKGWLANFDTRVGASGFRAVLLFRLIPNLPYDLQNVMLGCSGARFVPFLVGTTLGILPGAIIFVSFGHSLTDPRQLWKLLGVVLAGTGFFAWQQRYRRQHPV